MSQEIKDIIEHLTEKLGSMGMEVWRILIFQQYINFAISIILVICLIILTWTILHWFGKKELPEKSKMDFDLHDLEILRFVSKLVLGAICVLIILITLPKIMNPGYYAIKELLELK